MKKIFLLLLISFFAILYSVKAIEITPNELLQIAGGSEMFGATTLKVPNGGTGASSFTAGKCLYGNGTGAIYADDCSAGSMTALPEGQIYIGNASNEATTTNPLTLFDVLGQATSTLSSHTTTYNHANYDTAYNWGNHASAGYLNQAYASSTYFLASNYIDWTAGGAGTIHASNYVDNDTTYVSSNFTHNDLTGLQGGTTAQYYHLKSLEHSELTDWIDNAALGSNGAMTIPSITINSTSQLGTVQTGVWNGTAIDISLYSNLAVSGGLISLTDDTLSVNAGTLTNGKICTYVSGTGIVCNTDVGATEAFVYDTLDATTTLPNLTKTGQTFTSCYAFASSTAMISGTSRSIGSKGTGITVLSHNAKVSNGTSLVVNLSDGTNDMNSITASGTRSNIAVSTNNTWNAYEDIVIEFGTNTDGVLSGDYCINYKQN